MRMAVVVIPPLVLALSSALSACAETGADATAQTKEIAFAPDYQDAEAKMLDDAMLQVEVSMRGARDETDVEHYAQCVAAGHAQSKGFGFTRHLRTLVSKDAELWRADAVYLLSDSLPSGTKTIDAEVVAADCAENGIPMV